MGCFVEEAVGLVRLAGSCSISGICMVVRNLFGLLVEAGCTGALMFPFVHAEKKNILFIF